jgi:hypothetical protein
MASDTLLNETFDFAQAPHDHAEAFRGTPRRVLFEPGARLYRFTSLPTAEFHGNELFASPWWLPSDTFAVLTTIAHRTGSSLIDTARSRLAVMPTWNPTLEWLAIIELTRPVYGWVGLIRQQPLMPGHRTVLLLGNLDQAYVPGLAGSGGGLSSPYAFVSSYGSVK